MKPLENDFTRFLKEYNIVGLAIGVIIATATKDFINSIVDGFIMPIVGVVLPGEAWRTATTRIATIEFSTGQLIGAFLDFLIIALIVYLFARYLLKQDKVTKI